MRLKDGLNVVFKNKVVVITGPTAIGKTEISLNVAKYFGSEIINADASQFRKKLNIGTAKIDLNTVDVKHHLIDIIDVEDSFSIKDFQDLAREKIAYLHQNNILPILVGGSGLYINAAICDYELDDKGRNILREEELYKEYDNLSLHKQLESLDYEASKNIHPNNRKRVLRAIQKAKQGIKISSLNKGKHLIYDCLLIQLTAPRDVLYDRINRRFDVMINDGWLKEISDLKLKGIDLSKIKEIGYAELAQHLDGEISFEDASSLVKQKTRNYAKRQITWFKNKMDTIEVAVDYEFVDRSINKIINLIETFLNESI